jgi:uncharacterized SAM-binding protein YcdF (DUF218 family)
MITRILALLVLLYALCFVIFAFTLGRPAPATAQATDAAVVLTGGSGRIEHAMDVLRQRKAGRLLISGADPSVTRSNAEETGRWLAKHRFHSLRLITSDWHMRRARYEFRRVLGGRYLVVADAVPTEPSFLTLFGEYNKYLLRRIAAWVDL